MKRIFFCLFAVLCLSATVNAQSKYDDSPNNTAFFGEFGGPGILFSANLDKRFTQSRFGIGGRVGLGFVTSEFSNYNGSYYDYKTQSVVTIPVQLNYIFGKPNSSHGLEIGIGGTYIGKKVDVFSMLDNQEGTQFYGTFSFKYRRVPVNGGFTWNVGFSPLLAKGIIVPFAGVGFGYAF
ncbi:hypothetical protein [Polluticaenibacter yanchengensis]|uniref:Outer membrane protein beta-barrel domain-containing protein n=1 Tax=Polluticaenibacter yanchengensis TaxID=3014562 RepID=A0ABT4UEY5_9BACT|nr:hypothetical protein [Chitinophagaceae bacterium LY-5]